VLLVVCGRSRTIIPCGAGTRWTARGTGLAVRAATAPP